MKWAQVRREKQQQNTYKQNTKQGSLCHDDDDDDDDDDDNEIMEAYHGHFKSIYETSMVNTSERKWKECPFCEQCTS
jgi:hypothetical protein